MSYKIKLLLLPLLLITANVCAQRTATTGNVGGEIWQFRNYSSQRISSYDTSGANDDGDRKNPVNPGQTKEMGTVTGPGIIKHIWITIASAEHNHLKKLILRIYWDGNSKPSVEAPVGDFFGLGLGKYFTYQSQYISVGSQKALNCSFVMPFKKSARITITNEGERPTTAFYYNIDWEKHAALPENAMYFHAQYRQAVPTPGWTADWKLNGDANVNTKLNKGGEGNYVIMEAKGKGIFLGVTHSILQNQGDWWGEGDEMIFIDGDKTPTITGTGAEDYYFGAWCYGGCGLNPFGNTKPTFSYPDYGNPLNGGDDRGAEWMVYRFHTVSPVVFNSAIKMTIEHGHANHRSDTYYTVGYWYQTEPYTDFPPLPQVQDRIPRMVNTEGPTIGR